MSLGASEGVASKEVVRGAAEGRPEAKSSR